MYKEPKAMRQIHEIQEKIYEEMKHMTAKERIAAINKEVEEAERKHGLNLRKVSHVR